MQKIRTIHCIFGNCLHQKNQVKGFGFISGVTTLVKKSSIRLFRCHTMISICIKLHLVLGFEQLSSFLHNVITTVRITKIGSSVN